MKKITGYSKRGESHKRLRIENQDYYKIFHLKEDVTLLTVSDGMGSMKKAKRGAKASSIAVKKSVEEYLPSLLPFEKVEEKDLIPFYCLISKKWKEEIAPYKAEECGATCLFVIIKDKKCLSFILGDGMIYIKGKNSEKILCDEKEDFINTTFSLCTPHFENYFKMTSMTDDEIEGILLTTDGITSGLMEKGEKTFGRTFLSEIKKVKNKKRYIKSFIYEWGKLKHSDDKTIVFFES